jgi:hypothetical protein
MLSLQFLFESKREITIKSRMRVIDLAFALLALRLQSRSRMTTIETRFWFLGAAIDRAGFDGRFGRRGAKLANARKRVRRVMSAKGLI